MAGPSQDRGNYRAQTRIRQHENYSSFHYFFGLATGRERGPSERQMNFGACIVNVSDDRRSQSSIEEPPPGTLLSNTGFASASLPPEPSEAGITMKTVPVRAAISIVKAYFLYHHRSTFVDTD